MLCKSQMQAMPAPGVRSRTLHWQMEMPLLEVVGQSGGIRMTGEQSQSSHAAGVTSRRVAHSLFHREGAGSRSKVYAQAALAQHQLQVPRSYTRSKAGANQVDLKEKNDKVPMPVMT
jgi:hypothetical protein